MKRLPAGSEMVDLEALFQLNYGMYIVGSKGRGRFNGCIVNSVFQVTPEPPMVAMSINKENLTHEYISSSGLLTVSVLAEETPIRFTGLFGFRSGRDIDKFEQTNYKVGVTGGPVVLDHTAGFLEAEVTDQVDVGTHTLFIARVLVCQEFGNGKIPMTYAYYRDVKHGKTPRTAATYLKPKPKAGAEKGAEIMKKYKCVICGYVYDPAKGDPDNGAEPGTSFEDLPDGWVCPECGAGKEEFEPVEN